MEEEDVGGGAMAASPRSSLPPRLPPASDSGKRRLVVAEVIPEPHRPPSSRGGMGDPQGLEGGEEKQRAMMGEDPAPVLARPYSLLMAALQAAVIKSQLLESESIFLLSLVSKEASAAVHQHVRAIGGNAKVCNGSNVGLDISKEGHDSRLDPKSQGGA